MLIFCQIPVITRQCFQHIQKPFYKFMSQKYSKDIPGILWGYENVFMGWKSSNNCFVGYPVKFLILVASSLEMFFWTLLKPFFIESNEIRVMY